MANLVGLEAVLDVATSSNSLLPELRLASHVAPQAQGQALDPAAEETTSSIQDALDLPSGQPNVRFQPSQSGVDSSAEDTSQFDVFELYGRNPYDMESETDGGDESSFSIRPQEPEGARIPGIPIEADELPQLSGRSRALPKRYFEGAEAFRLPVGHPTIVFTESQVYNLLWVLTDETLSISYSTMERMVLDAVKGTPTVALPKTSHFQIIGRAQTPARGYEVDSSMSESGSDSNAQTGAESSDGMGGSSFNGEGDSATEISLISGTFKQAPTLSQPTSSTSVSPTVRQTGDVELSGVSSQDATLLELQVKTKENKDNATLLELEVKTKENKDQGPSKSKTQKKKRRAPQRGIPMREEFFAKIGWTRSFISGPADPLHNPLMVWCHMCKKKFSIRTMGCL